MKTRTAALAATALSAAIGAALGVAANASPPRTGNWWEKVTVVVPAGGEASCTFTSSREGAGKQCDVDAPAAALADAAPDPGQTTTITFERRFALAGGDADTGIGAGEMLLGGQVMKLAIGNDGKVASCKIVERADGMEPDYGCAEVAGEHFAESRNSEGLLTVLIYAHSEQLS